MRPDFVADMEGNLDIANVSADVAERVLCGMSRCVQLDSNAKTCDEGIADSQPVRVAEVGASEPSVPASVALREDRADYREPRIRRDPDGGKAGAPEVDAVLNWIHADEIRHDNLVVRVVGVLAVVDCERVAVTL
eukprot:SAG11_NODE_329_length_10681_cov_7.861274_8_plen_135_part_00